MTNNFPVKPCPNCGSNNRLKTPHTVWCADCGAISCPKCGSTRVVNGKVKSWELPSVACQLCGYREETPIKPILPMSREDMIYKRPVGDKTRVPCKVCGKKIDIRGKLARETGMCVPCNSIAKAEAALFAKKNARKAA